MKKAFLLFVATVALTLTSCSGDDSSSSSTPEDLTPVGTVTMKVDGVLKTYNTIAMTEYIDGGQEYRSFTASQNGSSSELVKFHTKIGVVGASSYIGFEYVTNSISQQLSPSTNILVNNDEALKINFSGLYQTGFDMEIGEPTYSYITDGVIDITYE